MWNHELWRHFYWCTVLIIKWIVQFFRPMFIVLQFNERLGETRWMSRVRCLTLSSCKWIRWDSNDCPWTISKLNANFFEEIKFHQLILIISTSVGSSPIFPSIVLTYHEWVLMTLIITEYNDKLQNNVHISHPPMFSITACILLSVRSRTCPESTQSMGSFSYRCRSGCLPFVFRRIT